MSAVASAKQTATRVTTIITPTMNQIAIMGLVADYFYGTASSYHPYPSAAAAQSKPSAPPPPPPPPFIQCVAALLEGHEFLSRLQAFAMQLRPPRHYSQIRPWHRSRFYPQREVHNVLRSLLKVIRLNRSMELGGEMPHGFKATLFQKMMVEHLLPGVKETVKEWTTTRWWTIEKAPPLIDARTRRDARTKRHRVGWIWHEEEKNEAITHGEEEDDDGRGSGSRGGASHPLLTSEEIVCQRLRALSAGGSRGRGVRGRGRGGGGLQPPSDDLLESYEEEQRTGGWKMPKRFLLPVEGKVMSSRRPRSVHSVFFHSVTQMRPLKHEHLARAGGGSYRGRGRGGGVFKKGVQAASWEEHFQKSEKFIVRPFLLKRKRKRRFFSKTAPPEIQAVIAPEKENDRDTLRRLGQLSALLGTVCAATHKATRSQLHQLKPIWTGLESLIKDTACHPETAKQSIQLMMKFPTVVDDDALLLQADDNQREWLKEEIKRSKSAMEELDKLLDERENIASDCRLTPLQQLVRRELTIQDTYDHAGPLQMGDTPTMLRMLEGYSLMLASSRTRRKKSQEDKEEAKHKNQSDDDQLKRKKEDAALKKLLAGSPPSWELSESTLRAVMQRAEAMVLRLFNTSPRSACRGTSFRRRVRNNELGSGSTTTKPQQQIDANPPPRPPPPACSELRERFIVAAAAGFVHYMCEEQGYNGRAVAALHNIGQRILDPLVPLSPERRQYLDQLLPHYIETGIFPSALKGDYRGIRSTARNEGRWLFCDNPHGEADRSLRIVEKALEVLRQQGEEARRENMLRVVLKALDTLIEMDEDLRGPRSSGDWRSVRQRQLEVAREQLQKEQ